MPEPRITETGSLGSDERRCGNCKFYGGIPGAAFSSGDCKRHAPSLLPLSQFPYPVFPYMGATDYCGDFEERDAENRTPA